MLKHPRGWFAALVAFTLCALALTPAMAQPEPDAAPTPVEAGADAQPAATDSALPPEAHQLVAHLEAIAAIMAEAGSDCDIMGQALELYENDNRESIQGLQSVLDQLNEAQQASLEQTLGARIQTAMEGIIQGMMTCSSDIRVSGIMEMFASPESAGAEPELQVASAPISPEIEQQAEQLVALFEEMSGVMNTHKDDCDAMGVALQAFADEKGEQMSAIVTTLEALDDAQDATLAVRYGERLEAAATGMGEGLMTCAQNPSVMRALEVLAP